MRAWHGVLDTLVRERRSRLVGYAYLLAGDRPTAEDLVHDAIIRTFSRARRLDHVNEAEAYVRRTILTQFLNRRDHAAMARSKLPLLVERDAPPADEHAGEHDAVVVALRRLPPRQRACVVLRHVEGLTTAETADRMGVSEGAVKRYLHDALAGMRETLGGFGFGDRGDDEDLTAVETRRRAR
ncbi:sigma-70 family RNA polymerase sigma factor [Demequina lignilytica]|uniref:Sigma-70 family RNA polymerase sigma factor n=1 Tax=Demequina lignilytica TaxID=3051663 RepID=A0AB35MJ41_9MICO|nr:sigma-70 family RNA polymerase sigma factor [Demequina sp. SYSU T0a273]MDN4483767.1 sigma-70 family RNA polymerase sigma factor [Demequina sp. SYSU T0a273]